MMDKPRFSFLGYTISNIQYDPDQEAFCGTFETENGTLYVQGDTMQNAVYDFHREVEEHLSRTVL